jgi:hypothetical protein
MKFSHQITYDAPPADVRAMLADPAFRKEVCAAMRAMRSEVDITEEGAGMTVVVDQTQPAKGIPSFAKRVVGDELRIVQRETWKGDSSADLAIGIPGKPGEFRGTVELAGDGDGTVETVAGDIRVKVPMVGGKLEGLVGDLLRAGLEAEQRVGRAWLSGR